MTTANEPCLDFQGKEIKIGVWVAHPQTGRSGLKFAYVMGFTKSGKPRCVSFENSTYWAGSPKDANIAAKGVFHDTGGWKSGWHREGPYHIDPDNVVIVDFIDEDILQAIEDVFHGDPMFDPGAGQI